MTSEGSVPEMTQKDDVAELIVPTDQKAFTSQRELAKYIGVNSRAEICANVHLVAPGSNPTSKDEYKCL